MESAILIFILLGFFVFIMPIMALLAAKSADRKSNETHAKLLELENRIRIQQRKFEAWKSEATPSTAPIPARERTELPKEKSIPVAAAPAPPPLPPPLERKLEEALVPVTPIPDQSPRQFEAPRPKETESPLPSFSIEQFLGVKMFAWLGGIALFFGVIFFVKYAFEHNLIPPVMRITIGFITGLGLLLGGLWTHRRKNYQVLAHSFCATGVLVLYGVNFAAHAVYQLPVFNQGFTFALMAVVTVTAFLTAVRLNALVVAVLGMLGGFLTPMLLPLVQDHPLAFFGYIALLDIGLLALASRGRWAFLASGAAAGTILMLIHWASRFFDSGRYFEGSATLLPMGILIGFGVLFLAAAWKTSRGKNEDLHIPASCMVLLVTAMGFAFFFLEYSGITQRVLVLYGYVLLINLVAILLATLHPRLTGPFHIFVGITFLHLIVWTFNDLKPEMLGSALAVYLIFGTMHTVWPAVVQRLKPAASAASPDLSRSLALWLPTAIIGLMSMTLFVLPEVLMILWPAVLLANILAIGVAAYRGAMLPVLASLVLTMASAGIWIFRMPQETSAMNPLIGVVLSFSFFFTGAGLWLAKRLVKRGIEISHAPEKLVPIVAGAMPFALLNLMILRVPLANPSPVFAAGMALTALLLGIALLGKLPLLHLASLVCCLALQGGWHALWFAPESPEAALAWYLAFYTVFTVIPFVFRKACSSRSAPWIASALSGVGHFLLIRDLVERAFPNEMMGLLPAAFAVPALAALGIEFRRMREMDNLTKIRLAWFGGVALLFITLIFPIQFDRQWLTVSWALEGACLIWLFRWVPHPGLIVTGVALLCISFIRLTLNPAVFLEYERSGILIFNWHLYTYGVVAAAQLIGALGLPHAHADIDSKSIRGLLCSLGGILLFLLLNIEIADFFTEPGKTFITFQFAGNFARDMTYTISWSLFSLALLIIGIILKTKGARFAAIGLLAAALIKLFLHDLANIENIFRVAALLCVGVIAFIASFLYQRFIPPSKAE